MDQGDTRSRLYAAAVSAFGAKGFHATTTRDLAAAAGLSPAALYVHHSSKESLLHEVSMAGHLAMESSLLDALAAAPPTPPARLAALVYAWVTEHALRQDAARVVNDELGALTAEHRAEVDAVRRRIEQLARDVIAEGVATGDFDADQPHLTARAVLSLGQDVAHWYRPDATWSPEDIAAAYETLALRMAGHRIG